jgi:hypothetical protein
MTEFKVFQEKEEGERPKIVYFRLTESGGGNIDLMAVDEEGERISSGSILTIYSDGTLSLHDSINGDIGLQRDPDRDYCIKVNP